MMAAAASLEAPSCEVLSSLRFARFVYRLLLLTAVAMFVCFPFSLSRVGSVVLIIGFAYMSSRCRMFSEPVTSTTAMLAMIENEIERGRSMLFNVPVFVGANLFWMGLPGPGTVLGKTLLDFVFLGVTVLVFAASYLLAQQRIRRELLPLRSELRALLSSSEGDFQAGQAIKS